MTSQHPELSNRAMEFQPANWQPHISVAYGFDIKGKKMGAIMEDLSDFATHALLEAEKLKVRHSDKEKRDSRHASISDTSELKKDIDAISKLLCEGQPWVIPIKAMSLLQYSWDNDRHSPSFFQLDFPFLKTDTPSTSMF